MATHETPAQPSVQKQGVMMSGFQLSGDAPTAYSIYAGKIIGTWTDELIHAAKCEDGDRVLDVACGTGLVASRVNLVSRKLCSVTGIDINDGMLAVARRNPQVEWHRGSATELPFEAGVFDVVLCQQGLQFFPDRSAAMGEMARVLAPGGRIALSVWGALEHQPFHAAVIAAIGSYLGSEARSAFDSAFSLKTGGELRQLAANAGFKDVHVRLAHRTMRYGVPARLVAGFMEVTPVTPQFLALSDDHKGAFITHVVKLLGDYTDDDGLAVPQEVRFMTASKPD